MSFTLRLTPEVVPVEAGSTMSVGVEVVNRADEPDEYELMIEGLDPQWIAVPVPTFPLDPQTGHTEKFLLKPPRESESVAGSYPFVVKVRSLRSGEQRAAQGMLEIKAFHHVSLDVNPKRGVMTSLGRECDFDVTVMNLSNAEHTFQLFGADVEDAISCEFEPDRITLGPGQQKQIQLIASGVRRSLLANNRLHGLTITARSVGTPNVVANTQAQIEQRALISPGAFLAGLFLFILAAAWWMTRPQPPTLDVLSVDPAQVTAGTPVTVLWRASHAQKVRIEIGKDTYETPQLTGSRTFTPSTSGLVRISAVAIRGDRRSSARTESLVVDEKARVPAPTIESFVIRPTTLNVGDVFSVSYKLGPSVTEATLSPPGLRLDLKIPEIELKAEREGTITYRLVAVNADGKRVERAVRVTVADPSDAVIVAFEASPRKLEGGGTVLLNWQTSGAVRTELRGAGDPMTFDTDRVETSVLVEKTTTLTLIAYDAEGRTSRREVRIEVTPPPGPPEGDPEPEPDPPATTTGGDR